MLQCLARLTTPSMYCLYLTYSNFTHYVILHKMQLVLCFINSDKGYFSYDVPSESENTPCITSDLQILVKL